MTFLSLYSLYVLECSKFVRKNLQKCVKESNVPELKLHIPVDTDRQMRTNYLYNPPATLNLCSQNPLIMAARILNKLPAALKVIEDNKVFVFDHVLFILTSSKCRKMFLYHETQLNQIYLN
jgi:hypothetical protein